jgi:SAM-dependent methyltransferase
LVHRHQYTRSRLTVPASRQRVLNIGSGPGFFLTHGKSRGWSGVGIEPSKQAGAYSRDMGLEIVEDFFDGLPLPSSAGSTPCS